MENRESITTVLSIEVMVWYFLPQNDIDTNWINHNTPQTNTFAYCLHVTFLCDGLALVGFSPRHLGSNWGDRNPDSITNGDE